MSELARRAMLVRLSISQPSMVKKDRKASNRTAEEAHADPRSVKTYKTVLECPSLDSYAKRAERLRTDFYALTLPWLDGGIRMCTPEVFSKINDMYGEHKKALLEHVEAFRSEYEAAVEASKTRLGDLYDPADYQTVDNVVRRFGVDIKYLPVPCADDFRVKMSADAEARIKQETEEFMREAEQRAMTDLWAKAHWYIDKMAEALSQPDKIFRDSLVTNVQGIAELLPALNVSGDPTLAKTAEDIRLRLCAQQPEALRKDKAIRAEVAGHAQRILAQVTGQMSAPGGADNGLDQAA